MKNRIPLPKGVTVRKLGTAQAAAADRSHNLLWRMAREPDVFAAIEMIGISRNSTLARLYLDTDMPHWWRRAAPSNRLQKMAAWLNAECYELMDLVEIPDVSTIGD